VKVVLLVALLLVAGAGPSRTAAAEQQQEQMPVSPPRPASQAPVAPVVSSPFLGGVPSGTATDGVETITIIQALTRALEHNLGVLTAEDSVGRAQGARWRALSDLLPNVNARVGETRQLVNLQAFGFGGAASPFPTLSSIVGPFNVFDARVFLSQSLLDFGALNDARAEAHNVEAARHLSKGARDFVLYVTGTLYVQALAMSARADAARAQQDTADALRTQALDLKTSGLVAGIDVLRSEVQLNLQRQRVTIAQNEFEKGKLQLARAIGLPLGQKFALDPALPVLPDADLSLDQAVEHAYATRPDYLAAQERVRAAEATRRAVVGDTLPSVRVNADYGDVGLSPADSHVTYSVAGAVRIPIFQGGRTRGRLLEADANIRSRRAEAEDLKASIYYEIRAAFLDLDATSQQRAVAGTARDLAAQQLTQARDRFAAGVANSIEIIQAQDALAVATEQLIGAQYGYDLAKGALSRGIGTPEQLLRLILGGRP
jgi:outer membrane protein TolC